MITFPVVDKQYVHRLLRLHRCSLLILFTGRASSGIQIDLSTVLELGTLWSSTPITNFANQLLPDAANANSGNIIGNRMFYANDYMVSAL